MKYTYWPLLVLALTLSTQASARSPIVLPPGLQIEVLVEVPAPTGLAFAPAGSGFSRHLFVSDLANRILEVPVVGPSAGVPTLFATTGPDPAELEFTPSDLRAVYGDYLYVAANNRDEGRPGDCGGTVQRVDPSGRTEDFTRIEDCISCRNRPDVEDGLGEPIGLAFGRAPFKPQLYVGNSTDWPANIAKLDATGRIDVFLDSSVCSRVLAPAGLELDPVGGFDTEMYFSDWICRCIRTVDDRGEVSAPIATFPAFVGDVEFSPGGLFGDYLYIASGDTVYRMDAGLSVTVFATGFQSVITNGAFFPQDSLEFHPSGCRMYIADVRAGRVYEVRSAAGVCASR